MTLKFLKKNFFNFLIFERICEFCEGIIQRRHRCILKSKNIIKKDLKNYSIVKNIFEEKAKENKEFNNSNSNSKIISPTKSYSSCKSNEFVDVLNFDTKVKFDSPKKDYFSSDNIAREKLDKILEMDFEENKEDLTNSNSNSNSNNNFMDFTQIFKNLKNSNNKTTKDDFFNTNKSTSIKNNLMNRKKILSKIRKGENNDNDYDNNKILLNKSNNEYKSESEENNNNNNSHKNIPENFETENNFIFGEKDEKENNNKNYVENINETIDDNNNNNNISSKEAKNNLTNVRKIKEKTLFF